MDANARPGHDTLPLTASPRARDSAERWMVPAALALALLCFATGERVPVSGGLGWDGCIYAAWAQDFYQEIFVKGVDSYYIQRILPSAIVHYSMRALGVSLTTRNVLRGFCLLDVGLIASVAWFWGRIARRLEISERGKWFGFVGFFVNYIILKHTFYCPVTTDVAAYALGAAMLWCYLGGHTLTLCAFIAAGAFTWPLTLPVGVLLLLFPRNPPGEPDSATLRPRWNVAAALLLTVVAFFAIKHGLRQPMHPALEPFLTPLRSVLNLSLAISLLYLFFGTVFLLDHGRFFSMRGLLTWRRVGAALLVLCVCSTIRYVQRRWAVGSSDLRVDELLAQTAHATVTRPGVFLVTHAAYYGPLFLLALFLWRPICRLLHRHGTGLTLAVGMALLLSLNSQSRFCLNVWVMLVPFIVKATDNLGWNMRQYSLFAGLALFSSKVWLTTNTGPFTGNLLEFPDQYLFMTHGPWISDTMYLVQGAVAAAVAALLYAVCLRPAAQTVSQAPDLVVRQAA